MDSLTQAVLGATVAVAVAGPKIGPRKAALAGAVLGTLPDLDVLYKHGDPVSDFVLHRGWSHSLLVHAALTPLIGEGLTRLFKDLRQERMAAYLTVFLCLTTHALLDAMTVYGTRLLWPVVDTPYGVGSVFIIDPLYTLPLLAATLWALAVPKWSARLKRVTTGALALSSLYLGWSLAAQRIADGKAREAMAAAGIEAGQVLATPMPFNTLLWRTIAVHGPVYYNIYQPVFGGPESARIHVHPRLAPGGPCLDSLHPAATVAAFSKGYYRILRDETGLRIADLRMGVTPSFVFDFRVAAPNGESWKEIHPERVRAARSAEGDVEWLLGAMFGDPAVRPAEASSLFEPGKTVLTALPDAPACG